MNKKVNVLIILTFLMILVMGGSYAYSKYLTNTKGNAKANVAKWNISVNNCNIVDSNAESNNCFETEIDETSGEVIVKKNFTVGDISYGNGISTMADNKIGPGSKGSFKITIEPNDTEVSIKYNLKVSVAQENNAIKLYRSNPNEDSYDSKIPVEEAGYNGEILYSKDNKNYKEVITIYVDWENKEDDPENDKLDTAIGTSGSAPKLYIPVEIKFEQYKG